MQISKLDYRKLLSSITIGLILVSVLTVMLNIKPVFAQTPLLADSEFNDSTDSTDLRNNGAGQDWYESRGVNASLLTLDTANIGGDATKKAKLNESTTGNAFLSQEFSSPQTEVFTAQWDIYVDSIVDISDPDRAGWMLIGDDTDPTRPGPNSDNSERFVYMGFFKDGGGTAGTMDLVARDDNDGWTSFTTVTTGLNLNEWYTIKVVCNLTSDTYDVYVDNDFKATVAARNAKTSVTHISFAQWDDGAGTFYVDNVRAPASQIKVIPSVTEALVGEEFTVYINVTGVTDLYGWEFQFDYDASMLDLTYNGTVAGGLKTPTNTFKDTTNETAGSLWWAVSTRYPSTTGISYLSHAIFEMRFNITNAGTSNLDLSGTILSHSNANPISHTVVNSSISTATRDLTVTEIEILNKHANETWLCSIYANDTYTDTSDYYYPVNVTISNTGTLTAENFKVKLEVYYDTTLEASDEKSVVILAGSSTEELTFAGLFHPNKTGDAGKYSLKATVDSQSDVAEDDEGNNDKTKNDFIVTIMGDVNEDKTVNILDAVTLALAWTGTPGDPQWNVCADLNHDEVIDILDGVRIGLHWGKTW